MSLFINQPEEDVVPRRVTVASSFNGKTILALLVVLIDHLGFYGILFTTHVRRLISMIAAPETA